MNDLERWVIVANAVMAFIAMFVNAGTAHATRTRRSASAATSAPTPPGKPCATSVVSSATTGRRDSRAARTSG